MATLVTLIMKATKVFKETMAAKVAMMTELTMVTKVNMVAELTNVTMVFQGAAVAQTEKCLTTGWTIG
jgi:hypothetical protein